MNEKVRVSSIGDIVLNNGIRTFERMNGGVDEDNIHMLRGRCAEDFAIKFYEELNNVSVSQRQKELSNDLLIGHIDGMIDNRLIEIKTTIKMYDEVPTSYILQCNTYLGLMREEGINVSECLLITFNGYWTYKEILINYDEEMYNLTLQKVKSWKEKFIDTQTAPQPFEIEVPKSNEELKSIIDAYAALSMQKEELELELKSVEEKICPIKEILIAAKGGRTDAYNVVVTQHSRRTLDTKKLAEVIDIENYYKQSNYFKIKIENL